MTSINQSCMNHSQLSFYVRHQFFEMGTFEIFEWFSFSWQIGEKWEYRKGKNNLLRDNYWMKTKYVNSNFNRGQNWQMGKIIAVSFFSFFPFFPYNSQFYVKSKNSEKTTKIYTVWLCKYYTVWKNEKTRLKDISWNQLLAS